MSDNIDFRVIDQIDLILDNIAHNREEFFLLAFTDFDILVIFATGNGHNSDFLDAINTDMIPTQGTSIAEALRVCSKCFSAQKDVKRAVVKQVTGMTGLTIAGVNLRIEDVLTPEEIASRNAASQVARIEEPAAVEVVEEEKTEEA